jgi:hypothetical protein
MIHGIPTFLKCTLMVTLPACHKQPGELWTLKEDKSSGTKLKLFTWFSFFKYYCIKALQALGDRVLVN